MSRLTGVDQVIERDAVGLLDGVVPVGVNLDPVGVGDDQQRRVPMLPE